MCTITLSMCVYPYSQGRQIKVRVRLGLHVCCFVTPSSIIVARLSLFCLEEGLAR